MEPLAGHATINPALFVERLQLSLDGHIAALRNILRSIEDGSFRDRQNSPSADTLIVFHLEISDDNKSIATTEIGKAYVSVIRSFLDFLDTLVALKQFVSSPLLVTRDLQNEADLEEYVLQELANRERIVARDQKLKAMDKIRILVSLPSFLKRAVEGYFDIRNAIEHHKSVSKKDLTFSVYSLEMTIDGSPIISLPAPLAKGSHLGYRVRESSRLFAAGEFIQLTEGEVEAVVLTILQGVVPEIMKALVHKPAQEGSID